jgi:hypothetical protein
LPCVGLLCMMCYKGVHNSSPSQLRHKSSNPITEIDVR